MSRGDLDGTCTTLPMLRHVACERAGRDASESRAGVLLRCSHPRQGRAIAEVCRMISMSAALKTMPMLAGAALLAVAGCGDLEDDDVSASFGAALGDRIPGTSTTDSNFAAFRENFAAEEEIDEGLGPIFNEHGCAVCHDRG